MEEDQGFYLIEISKSEKLLFIVAYDIQNIGLKYLMKMPLQKGLRLIQRNNYDIDKVAQSIRISIRQRKLYLVETKLNQTQRIFMN